VEFASIATAAAIVATTALTVETVDVVESAAAPVVAKVEERAEEKLQAAVEKEEGLFKKTLREAETGTVQYDAQQGKFVWQKGNGVFPEPE
jgi:hypothetical protein